MDMSLLKQLNNRAQIISMIERAELFGGDIWQSTPGSLDRELLRIIQIQNDIKQDKVIIRAHTFMHMDPTRPIFIRLSYRNIIFRLEPKDYIMMGDKLICNYPHEARALEERHGDRYVLPFESEISLSVKRVEKTVREMTYDMELRIIDVGAKGFGILISGYNRDYFKKNDHFWLKAIDHNPLSSHILGCVCYVAPKGYYLNKGDVRVGLRLQMPLPQEVFEYLRRKCIVVLSA